MSPPLKKGDVIAEKYEIQRELGVGAMGVVVQARHVQLGRSVALKFMNTKVMGMTVDPDALQRFMLEARAAARLRGENIAQVMDVGTLEDGTPYIVMEYLEGDDLRQFLRSRPTGRVPVAEAVGMILQACLAMAEAHAAGIVHRDLKPENLFLTRRPDGRPLIKVLDFGISKLFTTEEETSLRVQTQNTQILGSPFYMSPEQIESTRDTDARTDIWSVGVILYELTSGTLPYPHHGSPIALLARVVRDPPRPLSESAPDLPGGLYKVVHRCLAKEPDERYQDMAELAVALEPMADPMDRPLVASVCATLGVPHRAISQAESDSVVRIGRRISSDAVAMAATTESSRDDLHAALGATQSRLAGEPGERNAPTMDAPGHAPGDAPSVAPASARIVEDPNSLALEHRSYEEVDGGAGSGVGGTLELDTRPAPVDRTDSTMAGSKHHRRFPPRQLGYIAMTAVFGLLTALLAMDLGVAALFEPVNQLVFQTGYSATRSAREVVHLLGGPVLQGALPLVIIFISSWFFYRSVTLASFWWLGQTLMHMAVYIADASARERAPIAGDVHEWGTLMTRWELLDSIGDIASFFRWAGISIMVMALLAMALRARRPYDTYI